MEESCHLLIYSFKHVHITQVSVSLYIFTPLSWQINFSQSTNESISTSLSSIRFHLLIYIIYCSRWIIIECFIRYRSLRRRSKRKYRERGARLALFISSRFLNSFFSRFPLMLIRWPIDFAYSHLSRRRSRTSEYARLVKEKNETLIRNYIMFERASTFWQAWIYKERKKKISFLMKWHHYQLIESR
jgi:hypothetical protein